MSGAFDLVIVGSGFGGSLTAMMARRMGKSVLLLEKGRHPRVVIGESTTPLSNLMLEELADRYELSAIRPFSKWGTWQRAHREIACGLKRGFTFYHHDLDQPRAADPDRGDQLLVEASPRNEVADTHWWRADVDRFFLEEARRMGADYEDETTLDGISFRGDWAVLTSGKRTWQARFVIDATGPRGFLHGALGLGEEALPGMPENGALFSHFSGVADLGLPGPYPVDAAAVHHVFDGGWIWVLKFNNGLTSAGIAGTRNFRCWEDVVRRIPVLRQQFLEAKAERPFTRIPRLPFRSRGIAGAGWALLPSAAGFVDPLLSTGFPLTLAGILRLGEVFEGRITLGDYARDTEADLLAAAKLVGDLYRNSACFPDFIETSMRYFATVIYSETARRLGKPELAGAFLMRDRGPFELERINLAGLADPAKRNWYPIDNEELFRSAWKLGASAEEIRQLLSRSGFM